jgi:hypothetical protein
MQKKIIAPISIAATGFLAGGIMLGSMGAAAQGIGNQKLGVGAERNEVAAEILGVNVDELVDLRGSGTTFEEFVLENGYDSFDEFHDDLVAALEKLWAEEGVDADVIAERLDRMATREEFHGVMQEIMEDLLGVSHEELVAAREDGSTNADLILAAGYDSVQEFHEAVSEAIDEAGYDMPGHHMGQGEPKGHGDRLGEGLGAGPQGNGGFGR